MHSSNPIGIFDSGIGGLAIAGSTASLLPRESLIYIADSAYAPYGDQGSAFILQRCRALVELLINQGAKAIVVACNTATVSCIDKLRLEYSLPIIGVEPGIKPALAQSSCAKIGVLVTQHTAQSERFRMLLTRLAQPEQVIIQPCPGLVERIESLQIDTPDTRELLKTLVMPLLEQGIDQLVLGCTHYGFVSDSLQKIVGPAVSLINTSEAVARQVGRRLSDANILSTGKYKPTQKFYTSGDAHHLQKVLDHLWPVETMAESIADYP